MRIQGRFLRSVFLKIASLAREVRKSHFSAYYPVLKAFLLASSSSTSHGSSLLSHSFDWRIEEKAENQEDNNKAETGKPLPWRVGRNESPGNQHQGNRECEATQKAHY